jgi:hypothetical protein
MLAFRGVCGETPKRFALSGASPVPQIPQESRTLHFNQLFNEGSLREFPKSQNLSEKRIKEKPESGSPAGLWFFYLSY